MEERLKKIKAFAFDVDGVLTDGGILGTIEGELYRTYDAKDAFALRMAHTNSIYLFIKNGMNVPESDNYLYYSDEFQYAGTLLFFVSFVMTLYVGISFVVNRKKYKRIFEEETDK
mgnify:CR=1 FL=1